MNKKGFTLIELLIVIAIIAILAAVVFVALDPLTRFRDARDSSRWADASGLISAIKIDQVDNGGAYLTAIDTMVADEVYMIGTEVDGGCNLPACDAVVAGDLSCVDLAGLVTEGYLGSVPVSPNGLVEWGVNFTGYTLKKATTGIITVQACESENTPSIILSR